MKQHEIDANQGMECYDIRIHPIKSNEDQRPTEETVSLNENMLIEDLKSFILSITHEPFFLKFHMGNEETLNDLITRTK